MSENQGDKKEAKFGAEPIGTSKMPTITPKAPTYLAEHTVVAGDTLSSIALKYYKSAAQADWMRIYEANKTLIGSDPGKIHAGQVLKIPAK